MSEISREQIIEKIADETIGINVTLTRIEQIVKYIELWKKYTNEEL